MKICAVICEYNPFHYGHAYQIEKIKEKYDRVVCIMSGNFLQRGESSILEKHVRAKHAMQAGADVVLELPTLFATSNAELFAKGAIRILSSIPAVNTLCFGAENADKTAFKLAARYLNNEPKEVSNQIYKPKLAVADAKKLNSFEQKRKKESDEFKEKYNIPKNIYTLFEY